MWLILLAIVGNSAPIYFLAQEIQENFKYRVTTWEVGLSALLFLFAFATMSALANKIDIDRKMLKIAIHCVIAIGTLIVLGWVIYELKIPKTLIFLTPNVIAVSVLALIFFILNIIPRFELLNRIFKVRDWVIFAINFCFLFSFWFQFLFTHWGVDTLAEFILGIVVLLNIFCLLNKEKISHRKIVLVISGLLVFVVIVLAWRIIAEEQKRPHPIRPIDVNLAVPVLGPSYNAAAKAVSDLCGTHIALIEYRSAGFQLEEGDKVEYSFSRGTCSFNAFVEVNVFVDKKTNSIVGGPSLHELGSDDREQITSDDLRSIKVTQDGSASSLFKRNGNVVWRTSSMNGPAFHDVWVNAKTGAIERDQQGMLSI